MKYFSHLLQLISNGHSKVAAVGAPAPAATSAAKVEPAKNDKKNDKKPAAKPEPVPAAEEEEEDFSLDLFG